MNYSVLLEEVENFIRSENNKKVSGELPYHNLSHTEEVVANTSKLAKQYKLEDKDFFIVISAAWFHDCGYYTGDAPGHEKRGSEIAASFLAKLNVEAGIIKAVEGCILATHIPQSPENLLEKIICDADLYHLGTEQFSGMNKLLRKEMEQNTGRKIDKNAWRVKTIKFLESHQYQTEFGRNFLESGKQENLEKLKKKVLKEENLFDAIPEPVKQKENVQTDKKGEDDNETSKNKKSKNDRPDKGIETMFRISSGNHQRLSDMADNKANIMITTNSIIISVLLSVLLRKLEDNSNLIVPTLMLLTVCVTTMVFSILSTRPSVPHGTFSKEDIEDKKVNLLFFGNFYRMSFEDYAEGMQEMMNDREFLYGSLTKDVYSQGVVLGKKYRLLRTGYNIFMFGIVASVIAFVVSSMFLGS
ncbi:HD superfamily phosphodieaserase, includes HD domain of RNase Y [Dyadobacter koreensis]|uniref:HD superfamily phosphodieaserase, includes HD domain of RNase Y n=1 Tax=Dyadobacter koreensis TaxID=408657 RepID=A0A1H6XGW9_9BACT|nr:Pycsar system effector family protein [Dyadobacter koreensis]SEJ28368.1 HD superfamily phosphodieaserase, includes HD domain of RNase Y [Dyadobacter koreensis]